LATLPPYVPGYQNRAVGDVATASVTGLTVGVTYYYRVRRAENSLGVTANSGTQAVTTVAAPFNPGNSWHNPAMRSRRRLYAQPAHERRVARGAVYIYNGLLYQRPQPDRRTLYSPAGWRRRVERDESGLGLETRSAATSIGLRQIPGGVYAASNQVEYYLRITTQCGHDLSGHDQYYRQFQCSRPSRRPRATPSSSPMASCGQSRQLQALPDQREPAGAFMRNPVDAGRRANRVPV
jgi:hypothetical protein